MSTQTILDALNQVQASGAIPMHMPGHKRNHLLAPYLNQLSAQLDITEIHGCDCLHHADGIILRAMERGQRLWNAPHSHLLINGSTGGILAGIHAATRRGDRILMARGCHRAVYHAVSLCGLEACYLPQRQLPEGYYDCITPEQVAAQLSQWPDTKLVVITSPTYEGYLSDIQAIAQLCHRQDVILMVDEAHGAHLGFCNYFTGSALRGGADIVVQSLHKTLPSLTQTAIAHVQGQLVDAHQFGRSLSMFETSSPSYLLMASIDGCLQLLEQQGDTLFAQWQTMLEDFYGRMTQLKGLSVVQEPSQRKDPSKIIISTAQMEIDGSALKERLRTDYNIELEMAYGDYALAMTGMGDTPHHLHQLAEALLSLDLLLAPSSAPPIQYRLNALPPVAHSAHSLHNCPVLPLPLEQAVGQVCGSYLWAYPPGVPILAPGEVITQSALQLLEHLEDSGVDIQDTRHLWPKEIGTIPPMET